MNQNPTNEPFENWLQANAVDYPPLSLSDPLSRAALLMNQYRCDALPVTDNGRLIGLVKEADLISVLGMGDVDGRTVSSIVHFGVPTLHSGASRGELIAFYREHPGETAVPVVEHGDLYVGMVRPREILAAESEWLRPPRVGGMATPFGVHLHCGTARGGVNDFALFATGFYMMVIAGAAWLLVLVASWYLEDILKLPLVPIAFGHPVPMADKKVQLISMLLSAAPFIFFLTIMRLTQLTQFHAAEHMVVHTLERFYPLRAEFVRRMPRVHPRCGSNIVVPLFLVFNVFIFYQFLGAWFSLLLVVGVAATARQLGYASQQLFTTSPPDERHIESGLRSAELLLKDYRHRGRRRVNLPVRIWYMGLPQAAAGAALAYLIIFGLQHLLDLPAVMQTLRSFLSR